MRSRKTGTGLGNSRPRLVILDSQMPDPPGKRGPNRSVSDRVKLIGILSMDFGRRVIGKPGSRTPTVRTTSAELPARPNGAVACPQWRHACSECRRGSGKCRSKNVTVHQRCIVGIGARSARGPEGRDVAAEGAGRFPGRGARRKRAAPSERPAKPGVKRRTPR